MKDAKLIETYSDIIYHKSLGLKSLDKVIANIKTIMEIVESSVYLMRFFMAPIYSAEKKLEILEALDKKIKMEHIAKIFFKTLVQNDRVEYIRDIYEKLVDKKLISENFISATLTSARSISGHDIEECKEMLEKILEKKFAIKSLIDPSIIGGIVLRFGSNLYDMSVAGAKKNLTRGINED